MEQKMNKQRIEAELTEIVSKHFQNEETTIYEVSYEQLGNCKAAFNPFNGAYGEAIDGLDSISSAYIELQYLFKLLDYPITDDDTRSINSNVILNDREIELRFSNILNRFDFDFLSGFAFFNTSPLKELIYMIDQTHYDSKYFGKKPITKLKWLGTGTQFGVIMGILADQGFIEKPTTHGKESLKKYSKHLLEIFDVKVQESSLEKFINSEGPARNTVKAQNIIIPKMSELTI